MAVFQGNDCLLIDFHDFSCFILGTVFEQGATIKKNEKTGAITIARIMKGGAADRSGELYLLILTPSTNRLFFPVGQWLDNHTRYNRTMGIH